MDNINDLVRYIELHDITGIRRCFESGIDPNAFYNDQPLIYELTSEYTRSPRFKNCVRVFVDAGLRFDDEALLAVLLDDARVLDKCLLQDGNLISKTYSLKCAYTPLHEVSLLHICAEFNHLTCAEILVRYGADINAKAGVDENGFGGHTPIFHTVNQNNNQSEDMLHFLLKKGANTSITLPGLIWGESYEWETLIPAPNPVSYALMGLLPQMHRDEVTTMKIVSMLMKYTFGIDYTPRNVPNAYLRRG